jgi:hypothetical protein
MSQSEALSAITLGEALFEGNTGTVTAKNTKSEEESFATDGARMNTDRRREEDCLSVFIGALSVAKGFFFDPPR